MVFLYSSIYAIISKNAKLGIFLEILYYRLQCSIDSLQNASTNSLTKKGRFKVLVMVIRAFSGKQVQKFAFRNMLKGL